MPELIIKEKRFADMVEKLYEAYKKKIKFSFEAHFSGNPDDFKFFFSKIDISELLSVIENKEEEKVKNEVL